MRAMKKKSRCTGRLLAGLAGVGGLAIVLLLIAPTGCTTEDSSGAFLYEQADAYRGGALYDKWWAVPGVKEGIKPGATVKVGDKDIQSSLPADNPLYATNPAGNARSGAGTWRCKECHGWDNKGVAGAYGSGSHKSGFAGVFASRDKSPTDLMDIIRDGGSLGEGHAFGKVMADVDIADLVKFIREGTVDSSILVKADKTSTGDPVAGKVLFGASCGTCHGPEGNKINFKAGSYASEFLADIAVGNPWEFVHKVRFGQPNGEMPNGAVKAYYLKDVADILAYAQSLATPGLEEASMIRGGALWDNWWEINGKTPPEDTNPIYADAKYNTLGGKKSGDSTWRCKECHGWDYKGVAGGYGSGSHATGIKGVLAASAYDVARLKAIIGQGTLADGGKLDGHDFETRGLLSSGDVADLTLFIKTGLVDSDDFISKATGRPKGKPALGKGLFDSNCGTCHGSDGQRINIKDDDPPESEYLGDIFQENPQEGLHKIRFGVPGSDEDAAEMEEERGLVTGHMPNMFDAGYTLENVLNLVAYCATLPDARARGGKAWDKWWKVNWVAEPIEPGKSITLQDGTEKASSLPATNPAYTSNPEGNTRAGSQTYRCKECHGWDLRGKDGAYASGGHKSGFPGVYDARSKDAQILYDAIFKGTFSDGSSDPKHAFGTVLGDDVSRDLVVFIQKMVDYDRELIYTSGDNKKKLKPFVPFDATTAPDGMKVRTREASQELGALKFSSNCASCHGPDGAGINFAEDEGEVETVGVVARDNPWEFAHKILNGQPGSHPMMPPASAKYYSLDDVADLILFGLLLP